MVIIYLMLLLLFGTEGCHNIFRLCADAEFAAPDAQAGTHIKARVVALKFTPRAFVYGICNP